MATQEALKKQLAVKDTKESKQPVTLEHVILGRKDKLEELLPKNVGIDRFVRTIIFSIQKNPRLQNCSASSIIGGAMQAAQLGLEPSDSLGHCYLIPYGSQCQFQIGYKGLIELAYRSGRIKNIYAGVVKEGDELDYQYGSQSYFRHKPDIKTQGKPYAYYAYAEVDGTFQFEILSLCRIEEIKKISKSSKSGPWVDHYDAMAKKTVLKQLLKTLPLSTDLAHAQSHDEDVIDVSSFELDPSVDQDESEQ